MGCGASKNSRGAVTKTVQSAGPAKTTTTTTTVTNPATTSKQQEQQQVAAPAIAVQEASKVAQQHDVQVKSVNVTTDVVQSASDGKVIGVKAEAVAVGTTSTPLAEVKTSNQTPQAQAPDSAVKKSSGSLSKKDSNTTARKSLEALNSQLQAEKAAGSSTTPSLGRKKTASTTLTDGKDALKKSGSQASLGSQRHTVLIKKSGSRQSMNVEKDKKAAQSTSSLSRKSKEEHSAAAQASLEQLNQQLAAERGLPLAKAASVKMDGAALVRKSNENVSETKRKSISKEEMDPKVKASLESLNAQLAAERGLPMEKNASIHLSGSELKKSVTNLVARGKDKDGKQQDVDDSNIAPEPAKTQAVLEQLNLQLQTEKGSKHSLAASNNKLGKVQLSQAEVIEAALATVPSEGQHAEQHHRSVKEVAHDAKQSIKDLVGHEDKAGSDAKVLVPALDIEKDSATHNHRSIHDVAHDAKKSIEKLNQVSPEHALKSVPPAETTVPDVPGSGNHAKVKASKSTEQLAASNNKLAGSKNQLAGSKQHLDAHAGVTTVTATDDKVLPHETIGNEQPSVAEQVRKERRASRTSQSGKPTSVIVEHAGVPPSQRFLTYSASVAENATQEEKTEEHRRKSVKDLAHEAKQSLHQLVHNEHGAAGDSQAKTPIQEAYPTAAELNSEHKGIKDLAHDAKQSLQNLVHHSNGDASKPTEQQQQPGDHEQSAKLLKNADTTKSMTLGAQPATATNESHHRSVRDLASDAKKSLSNLVHGSAGKMQDVGENGATLETTVQADLSKHDGAKDQVKVQGSVDVIPASAAADPAVKKSADQLAGQVDKQVKASAQSLQNKVDKHHDAEVHTTATERDKIPVAGSTKSLAKDIVGKVEQQAEQKLAAGSSRPPSGTKKSPTASRPHTPKKLSRPTSSEKLSNKNASKTSVAAKGSTAALTKSASVTNVRPAAPSRGATQVKSNTLLSKVTAPLKASAPNLPTSPHFVATYGSHPNVRKLSKSSTTPRSVKNSSSSVGKANNTVGNEVVLESEGPGPAPKEIRTGSASSQRAKQLRSESPSTRQVPA